MPTVNLTCVADAYTDQTSPTSNYGTATDLVIDKESTTAVYVWLMFDIPAGGAITSATLNFNLTNASSSSSTAKISLVQSSWDESTLNWNNQPALGTDLVNFVPAPVEPKSISLPTEALPASGLVSFRISGSSSNAGEIASRETATPPTLVLVREEVGGAVTVTKTVPAAGSISADVPAPTGDHAQYVSTSAVVSQTTSTAVPRPAGTQTGDVMVLLVHAAHTSGLQTPSGWSSSFSTASGGGHSMKAYTRRIADINSEPASYTFTTNSAASTTCTIVAYRYINSTTFLDATPVPTINSLASTEVTANSITTVTKNAVVLWLGASLAETITEPAGTTRRHQSLADTRTTVSDFYQTAPGATGPRSGSMAASGTSMGVLIALRPANPDSTPSTPITTQTKTVPAAGSVYVEPDVKAFLSVNESRNDAGPIVPTLGGAEVVSGTWRVGTGDNLSAIIVPGPVVDSFDSSRTFMATGDLHEGDPENDPARRTVYSNDISSFVSRVATRIYTGDITDHGTASEFASIKALLDGPNTNWHCNLGNHDWYELVSLSTLEARTGRPQNWYVDVGTDIRIIGLGANGNSGTVTQTTTQLNWMEARISETTRMCVITMHAPLYNSVLDDPLWGTDLNSTQSDRYIRPWPDVLNRLDKYPNAKMYLSGHTHSTLTAPQLMMQYPMPSGGTMVVVNVSSISRPGKGGTDTGRPIVSPVFTMTQSGVEIRWRDHATNGWAEVAGNLITSYVWGR